MAFSDDIVRQAFARANEQCECNRRTHSHFRTPCVKPLVWKNRGVPTQGGWEAHQYSPSGGDTLANCEILCTTCYKGAG